MYASWTAQRVQSRWHRCGPAPATACGDCRSGHPSRSSGGCSSGDCGGSNIIGRSDGRAAAVPPQRGRACISASAGEQRASLHSIDRRQSSEQRKLQPTCISSSRQCWRTLLFHWRCVQTAGGAERGQGRKVRVMGVQRGEGATVTHLPAGRHPLNRPT